MYKADKCVSFHPPEGCPQDPLTYTATCGPVQLQMMSETSWLCCNPYLEGDDAVVFGSFQEDPAVAFLSPLVLTIKQPSNKALKPEVFLSAFCVGDTSLSGPQLWCLLPGQ